MDSVKELAKQIAGYIKGKKTRAYDTAAEVRRIVGNTAYVHIPGGVPETPVKLTIDAKVGDTVQVRVANSTAWLVGNSTAPPTDDTKAKEADANAGKAMTKAKEAETIAEEGLKEAQGTSNYFWHVDGSGAESGAHVTEIPQAEFQANPSGGNLLMRSNVIKIRQALITLAELDASGMTVYDSNGVQRAQFGAWSTLGDPTSNNVQIGDNTIQWRSGATYKASVKYDPAVPCLHFRDTPVKMDAMLSGVFDVTSEEIFPSSAITGNGHVYSTVTVTKAKYYPLGIVGFNSPDTPYFVPLRLRLSAQSTGSGTVSYDIKNVSSSDRTGSYKVDILWLKVSV